MNEHELDQRIRAALVAEPSPEQLARLEEFWQRRSRSQRRRRLAQRAVAASVAVLAGTVAWLVNDRGRVEQSVAANQPAPRTARPQEKPRPTASTFAEAPPVGPVEASRSAGREPTPYERLMFTVQVRQAEAAETSRFAGAVDAAIAQLAADPGLAADRLADASLFKSPEAEEILLRRLPRADQLQAGAIVRLLGQCGTKRSAPALLRMARQDSLRPAALAAIERITGLPGLAAVARQSGDRTIRRALFERLLTAHSDVALRAYLSLVPDPSMSGDALAAADAITAPPMEELLALLRDENKGVRVSAAMVLGRMNGPHVTAALIAIVTEESAAPVEAWLALLACRDESADRFLAVASQHPRLLGHVNNARMTWARMVQ